jgi:hypothetical protein
VPANPAPAKCCRERHHQNGLQSPSQCVALAHDDRAANGPLWRAVTSEVGPPDLAALHPRSSRSSAAAHSSRPAFRQRKVLGARLQVKDGQKVERAPVLVEWDPYRGGSHDGDWVNPGGRGRLYFLPFATSHGGSMIRRHDEPRSHVCRRSRPWP